MARWKLTASAGFVLVVALVWALFANRSPLRVVLDVDGERAVLSLDGQALFEPVADQ
jgi:hypothetical protein